MATPGSPLIIRRGEEMEMENLDERNKETGDLGGNKEDENTESTSKYCCIDLQRYVCHIYLRPLKKKSD